MGFGMNKKKLQKVAGPRLFSSYSDYIPGFGKHLARYVTTFMVCFMFAAASAFAQSHQVSGVVTDANTGDTLPGVNILVVGTDLGTTTNLDGEYSISIPSGDETLRFSYIGYQQLAVGVNGRNSIDVQLETSVISGEELLVVGYSSQQRQDITGSISVVKMDDFERLSAGGDLVSKQLQGVASGVSVVSSGQPGESPDIRIRGINTFGNNSPLVIIDGVPGNIENLNPNDVESIQVLKDASAASIYGARASNGVIVVTTKKGGGNVEVNYRGSYGVDWQGRDNPWDIATPQDHANLVWTALANSGAPQQHPLYGSGATPTLPDFVAPAGAMEGEVNFDDYFVIPEYTDGGLLGQFYRITRANKEGTDWFNEIMRTANTNQHDISVNGGSEMGNFLFSVNYLNQEGTLMRTFRDRITMRANTSFNLGENFRIGENLQYTVSESPTVASLTEGSAIGMSFRAQPIIPVYDINGNFGGTSGTGTGNAQNPVADMERTRNNESQTRNLFGNVFAELDFLENFRARTTFGGELWNWSSESFVFPTYERQENNPLNQLNTSQGTGYNWTWTNTLQYTETFDLHDVEVLVGTEAYRNAGEQRNASVDGFFSFNPDFVNLSTGSGTPVISSFKYEDTLLSFFGRVDYSYDNRYILGLTIRRDGSSRFLNNQWGWFPAASVGWRISQEEFMADVDWISDLRLIGGYGIMGNQINVDPANAFTLFTGDQGNSYYSIDGSNNSIQEGFRLSRIGNPNAEWEKNVTANFGFDASLFDEKYQVSVEYYFKDVQDLLFNPQLIGSSGVATAPFVNVANMENRGIDASLAHFGQISNDWQYNVNLTFTSYSNEIKKIADDIDFFAQEARRWPGQTFIRNEVGQSVSSFYGYQIEGFWQSQSEIDQANSGAEGGTYQLDAGPGRFRYADINGDGQITADDRTFLGDPNPDFTYGISFGMNYRAWDFNMFWYGSQGNEIWNQVKYWTDFYASFIGAKSNTAVYDSWSPENPNATAPIQENENFQSTAGTPNSYFVEDGSYLRLRNLQVGYSLQPNILDRVGIKNLRLYVQGNNLVTFTGYSGPDPEIGFFPGDGGGGSTNFGIDEGQYPTPKQFLFGINLTI
jgi:TonB-linked SusC/RagA family outer membrane protein